MNLYVSNLSFNTTDSDLKQLFSQFGAVASAKVITDRETGRSRGFGFVEMESESDARESIKALNGKELGGRSMNVSEAREKSPRPNNNRNW